MSPLTAQEYGLDADRLGEGAGVTTVMRRRVAGRFLIDPFGFDPQLTDLVVGPLLRTLPLEIVGAEHVPTHGPVALVANRGVVGAEPTALSIAVRRALRRRLRPVGTPALGAPIARRLGAIDASATNVAAALRSGVVVGVPFGTSWLSAAGEPPLELLQAIMGFPVVPVAVRPSGPLRTPVRWRVEFGPVITAADDYPHGDPLGAAELAEALQDALAELLSH